MSLFTFYFLEFTAIYIILAWAIYLPFRINQVYFGSIYSMCVGAYFSGYISREFGWPFWLALAGAAVLCVLISLIFAHKLASLAGFPMMLASTAFVFIIQAVIRNLGFLGGSTGLYGIPFVPQYSLLVLTYGIIVITGFFIYRLESSHLGRAMDAIRSDPTVASSLGIDIKKVSVQLQIMASALGGISGGLYAFTFCNISLEAFGFSLITFTVSIVIVGGMNTMWGILITAPLLWSISQFVPDALKNYSNIIYAALLIIVLILRPAGLIDRKMLKGIHTFFGFVMRRSFILINR